jgi:protein-S-isoprenylcysteine O-methyltransferase Ste14
VRRLAWTIGITLTVALVLPAVALAHEAPQNSQSKWVMADWMIDTFFVFSGIALVGFLVAWKAGHFHELDKHGAIPLFVEEEDYYTPEWADDEEEWKDG